MVQRRHDCRLITFVALLLMPGSAFAQAPTTNAATPPLPPKSVVKADMVPSLIVMNARGASLQGQTLTLTGIGANSIVLPTGRSGPRAIY